MLVIYVGITVVRYDALKIFVMNRIISFSAGIILCFTIYSCKKESSHPGAISYPPAAPVPIEAAASYKIIITGTWRSPQHTIPANEHFTPFVGMVHNAASHIFRLNEQASLGVENIAEVGNSTVLNTEMDSYILEGKALNKFSVTIPGITGKDSVNVNVTSQNALVSFESMIAPSPDWFAGLDSYNLIQNGKWVTDITVNIQGYDAGTEDGNIFGYNNPTTVPQQNIGYLTPAGASVIANGNAVIAPFATVRFIKL